MRDTVKEQRVFSELAELIDNDIDPSNKTQSGLLELVKLIHRNLCPNNPVMLAMNKIQPSAKTWHEASDLGYFKATAHSNHNTDSSGPSSKQKRQKRGDEWRERNNSSKPFNAKTCWTCGIKGHSKPECSKSAHPDVPFLQCYRQEMGSKVPKRTSLPFKSQLRWKTQKFT
jgi:hypothetical protein